MFMTITRTGSLRELRVLATAIAYIDEAEDFTLVKLTSGEALRASEDRATLEERIDKALRGDLIVGELLQVDEFRAELAAPAAAAPAPVAPKPASTPKSKAR